MSHVVNFTSTYSKAAYLDLPDYPVLFISAEGCKVKARTRDAEIHTYIDFTASLGAIILGYPMYEWWGNLLLPGPHESEEQAATALCEATGWSQVRWCKNGSDATEAAVRLARFVTNGDTIIANSYHGSHSDLVMATPGKSGGILLGEHSLRAAQSPQDLLNLIREEKPACVIMEPITPTCPDWRLREVQAACKETGTLLIFDEILTGFRSRYGSITDVKPDLACYGKAIGNGASIACVAGPRHLMHHYEKDVFMSGTYATDIMALMICHKTLETLRGHNYGDFAAIEMNLREELKGIATGYRGRLQIQLPQDDHRRFVNALAKRGVLVGRDFFLMFAHQQLSDAMWDLIITLIGGARQECNL